LEHSLLPGSGCHVKILDCSESEGSKRLWNSGTYVQIYVESRHRRRKSSSERIWKSQTSLCIRYSAVALSQGLNYSARDVANSAIDFFFSPSCKCLSPCSCIRGHLCLEKLNEGNVCLMRIPSWMQKLFSNGLRLNCV
jgi:hypothetical protein